MSDDDSKTVSDLFDKQIVHIVKTVCGKEIHNGALAFLKALVESEEGLHPGTFLELQVWPECQNRLKEWFTKRGMLNEVPPSDQL